MPTETCGDCLFWFLQTGHASCHPINIIKALKGQSVKQLYFSQCSHSPFASVLWHCWFCDRKGIRPVKNLVLVCCWRFDWSFARLTAPVSPPPSSLAPIKSEMETFWYRLTQVHLKKMAVKIDRFPSITVRESQNKYCQLVCMNADKLYQFPKYHNLLDTHVRRFTHGKSDVQKSCEDVLLRVVSTWSQTNCRPTSLAPTDNLQQYCTKQKFVTWCYKICNNRW